MLLTKLFHADRCSGIAGMLLAAILGGVAAILGGVAVAENAVAPTATPQGPQAGESAFRHLQAFQAIATANGGNRAAGTPGYDRSAEYVAEALKAAGYRVRLDAFDFPFFEERKPPVLALADAGDKATPPYSFRTLTNSGSGDVTTRLRAVNLGLDAQPPQTSASGCEAHDFADFERGSVALLRRGSCTFQIKADNAIAAGAVAVVIMNEGTEERTSVFNGQMAHPMGIPIVAASYEFGRSLAAAARDGAAIRIAVDAVSGRRPTHNVIADTPAADDGPLVVVGAHLDSVPEGPGINDNGSGSAAVLEAALRLAHRPDGGRAHLRFAFWGAEERGLIGSRHYVEALSDAERHRIGVYINLDMVGSPNFIRLVQGPAPDAGSLLAVARRELFEDFREHDLPFEQRDGSNTGTDDASFSRKEIPTVGLYTGDNGHKSEAQAATFGGTVGEPFDRCYHQACDTLANIDRAVFDQNTRALVRALAELMKADAVVGAPASQPRQ